MKVKKRIVDKRFDRVENKKRFEGVRQGENYSE